MLGNTHATNSILGCRAVGRGGANRLGAPAAMSLSPTESRTEDLQDTVRVGWTILRSGHYRDSHRISELDEACVVAFVESVRLHRLGQDARCSRAEDRAAACVAKLSDPSDDPGPA